MTTQITIERYGVTYQAEVCSAEDANALLDIVRAVERRTDALSPVATGATDKEKAMLDGLRGLAATAASS